MVNMASISNGVTLLPTTHVSNVATGITLWKALSNRGVGPGLIILALDNRDGQDTTSTNTEPMPASKWAEESYTVVEIRPPAFTGDREPLKEAIDALQRCHECVPQGYIGLISYNPKLWNLVALSLKNFSWIAGAVIYDDASNSTALSASPIPSLKHLAGKPTSQLERSDDLTAYGYSSSSSFRFATPNTQHFQVANEALSHSRNLTFLKKHMEGPYFDLEKIWEEHTQYQLATRLTEHTMSTMVREPYVNHIPTMTGGIGRTSLTNFYEHHFIHCNPRDTEMQLISRTIGIDRVVDEFIFTFTHDTFIDWLLPGIPPTNEKCQVPMTAIVTIRGDRICQEHISWDQGTVLRQLGLLPEYAPFPYPLPDGKTPGNGKRVEYRLPVAGKETADKVRDKNAVVSNEMLGFEVGEV